MAARESHDGEGKRLRARNETVEIAILLGGVTMAADRSDAA